MNIPVVKPKNEFQLAVEKLDLQGCLLLLNILSERALYLQSISVLDRKAIVTSTSGGLEKKKINASGI